MIPLQHRASAATAAMDAAKTPLQKHLARQEGLAVKADLEKQIGDDAALAAFKAAQPQNSLGMYKDIVRDHPMFLVGPGGNKIKTTVILPDGSKAMPNPQGQIVVEARFVPAMLARGFVQANSVFTPLGSTHMRDPAIPNGT
jgi:hypothetical protein